MRSNSESMFFVVFVIFVLVMVTWISEAIEVHLQKRIHEREEKKLRQAASNLIRCTSMDDDLPREKKNNEET